MEDFRKPFFGCYDLPVVKSNRPSVKPRKFDRNNFLAKIGDGRKTGAFPQEARNGRPLPNYAASFKAWACTFCNREFNVPVTAMKSVAEQTGARPFLERISSRGERC